MSISGDYAIVGATGDDDKASDSGSAYIFERDPNGNWNGNWGEKKQKLLASDGWPEDRFGGSVSISGNYALIGAIGDDDKGSHSGSAYLFERDPSGNWTEKKKLLASEGEK